MSKLSEHLRQTGESQKAFAERIGKNQAAVSRYCNGRIPDKETMKAIVAATGGAVTPNDFYGVAPQAAAS